MKSLEAPGAAIMRWWERLGRVPGGKTLFSILVGHTAPYTSTAGDPVSTDIRDAAGDVVARATVTWLLAPINQSK